MWRGKKMGEDEEREGEEGRGGPKAMQYIYIGREGKNGRGREREKEREGGGLTHKNCPPCEKPMTLNPSLSVASAVRFAHT